MINQGTNYMDFMAHPDEPEYSGIHDPKVYREVEKANHQQLKKQVWSKFF